MMSSYDAVVVGSGPNGLAAAITLARAGLSVLVQEAQATIGGGACSAELTLPGFVHDLCSAVHPLAVASPFFRSLALGQHGLEWVHSPAALAHPLDAARAVMLERAVPATASALDRDERHYRILWEPLVRDWPILETELLGPPRFPRHPIALARFGARALRSARGLAEAHFVTEEARALFGGLAAHSMLSLEQSPSAAFGLILGLLGHLFGWPVPRGGARRISEALASCLRTLGGKIATESRVRSLCELPPSRVILCDITPRQLLEIAGNRLPSGYQRQLRRYRYGLAAFKLDWALGGPIPWRAADCLRSITVHLGGSFDEIAASERLATQGQHSEKPYVLIAQPSLFDPSRAPAGKHTAWGYCHVPNGSSFDMTERIERQIERFAPGFRDLILARNVMTPASLEARNANLIGGDINGGTPDLRQLLLRPTSSHYETPLPGLYLCSASTPPGGGVHGMCGYHAAQAALDYLKGT
jgi:phytoene dehydrogenase-like protein